MRQTWERLETEGAMNADNAIKEARATGEHEDRGSPETSDGVELIGNEPVGLEPEGAKRPRRGTAYQEFHLLQIKGNVPPY